MNLDQLLATYLQEKEEGGHIPLQVLRPHHQSSDDDDTDSGSSSDANEEGESVETMAVEQRPMKAPRSLTGSEECRSKVHAIVHGETKLRELERERIELMEGIKTSERRREKLVHEVGVLFATKHARASDQYEHRLSAYEERFNALHEMIENVEMFQTKCLQLGELYRRTLPIPFSQRLAHLCEPIHLPTELADHAVLLRMLRVTNLAVLLPLLNAAGCEFTLSIYGDDDYYSLIVRDSTTGITLSIIIKCNLLRGGGELNK
jgi:hypothetical protein